MKSFIRKSLLGAAMVAPLVLALPGTASAAGPDAIVVVGTGGISPGLPCPSSCAVTLTFTAVFAGADAGVANCTFTGTGGADTLLQGSGDGDFTCDNGATGSVHFERTLAAVTLSGQVCLSAGNCASIVVGVLGFVPLDANPTTSFIVAGAVVVA